MSDIDHINETIRKINSLQLSGNLIIDLEDAKKAMDVVKAVNCLQSLATRWN